MKRQRDPDPKLSAGSGSGPATAWTVVRKAAGSAGRVAPASTDAVQMNWRAGLLTDAERPVAEPRHRPIQERPRLLQLGGPQGWGWQVQAVWAHHHNRLLPITSSASLTSLARSGSPCRSSSLPRRVSNLKALRAQLWVVPQHGCGGVTHCASVWGESVVKAAEACMLAGLP